MNKKGFTLIELLLYVSILGGVMFVIVLFLQLTYSSRVKNNIFNILNSQAILISSTIDSVIYNSSSVSTPTIGNNASSLTAVSSAGTNIFTYSSENLSYNSTLLNGQNIKVSNINFYNISTSSKPVVKYQFTLYYKSDSTRNEYKVSKTYYGTVTSRN